MFFLIIREIGITEQLTLVIDMQKFFDGYTHIHKSKEQAFRYGISKIFRIPILKAPQDIDWEHFGILHDTKDHRAFFLQKGSSSLYQFALNQKTRAFIYGYNSMKQIKIVDLPRECKKTDFAMFHDGKGYFLCFREDSTPTKLHLFRFNTRTPLYEPMPEGQRILTVEKYPKDADLSRWGANHNSNTMQLYVMRSGSVTQFYQGTLDPCTQTIKFDLQSTPLWELQNSPSPLYESQIDLANAGWFDYFFQLVEETQEETEARSTGEPTEDTIFRGAVITNAEKQVILELEGLLGESIPYKGEMPYGRFDVSGKPTTENPVDERGYGSNPDDFYLLWGYRTFEGHISELGVNNKKLTEFPENFGDLRWLKILKAEHNQIATLPQSISKITALHCVYLSDNKLTNLPAGFQVIMGDPFGVFKNGGTNLDLRGNPINFLGLSALIQWPHQKKNIQSHQGLIQLFQNPKNQNDYLRVYVPPTLLQNLIFQPVDIESLKVVEENCKKCGSPKIILGKSKDTKKVFLICPACEELVSRS